jgi:hypothetical protein
MLANVSLKRTSTALIWGTSNAGMGVITRFFRVSLSLTDEPPQLMLFFP